MVIAHSNWSLYGAFYTIAKRQNFRVCIAWSSDESWRRSTTVCLSSSSWKPSQHTWEQIELGLKAYASQISVSSSCQAMSRRLSLMSNGPFALLGSSWTGFNANGRLSLPWARKADPGQPTGLFGKDPKDCRCSDCDWLNILGSPTYFGLSKDWRTLLVAVTVMAKVIKRDCVRNLFQSWYKCREKILPGEHQWLIIFADLMQELA